MSRSDIKMLFAVVRRTTQDEDLMTSVNAKNKNLESELCTLREMIQEQDELNGSCVEAELRALRLEKKRLEELVAEMRNEQRKKSNDSSSVDELKKLKAEKIELEEKLSRLSAELERYQRTASDDVETELTGLREEKHRLDLLVTHLKNEVQQHKDSAHEQRIRALDLKHELREV